MYHLPTLVQATRQGNLHDVTRRINAGEDPNTVDDYQKKSILSIAVEEQHKQIVEFLLSRGAKVDHQDKDGKTPLHYALQQYYTSPEICLLLIQGATVDHQDTSGKTPLHYAVQQDYTSPENCLLLIEKGATAVRVADKAGQTPLYYAVQSGKFEICRILIQNGASVNEKDKGGSTMEKTKAVPHLLFWL
eukprot:TRINITY_DN3837_c0_g1_i4.p1 TRINITY_DN3837_c0_g1~~TRINITY_DN3837_c0_g1_i4.p1  ORF type:complete len:190 (-),score=38.16 TRINITY_DN3837_c0_g1_i4:339-908(-)